MKSTFAHGLDRTPTVYRHIKIGTQSLAQYLVARDDSVRVGDIARVREDTNGSRFFRVCITRDEGSFLAGDLV